MASESDIKSNQIPSYISHAVKQMHIYSSFVHLSQNVTFAFEIFNLI